MNQFLELSKERLKRTMLQRLHGREEIVSQLATKVCSNGIPRMFRWSYDQERADVLSYVDSLRVDGFDYKFSTSTTRPVIYASCYAFMLKSMFNAFDSDAEVHEWIKFFDQQQSEDGLFRDPALAGEAFEGGGSWGDGWGARHLAAHMIIPYARAQARPKVPFYFLEPYYDLKLLDDWLSNFDLAHGVWSQSNYIMNVFMLLQFARDYMDERRAAPAVARIAQVLLDRQNRDTGMWHRDPLNDRPAINDAIRGAYHFYPLFAYDKLAVPYQEKTIDQILLSQNSWGAFENEDKPSGACEDIDALDPLIRFSLKTRHRTEDVRLSVQRAFVWLLACRNPDGGSVSLLENGCHYGDHPQTTSAPGESNLFATWFRTLTTAYVTEFLGMPQSYTIGRYPGYEMPIHVGALAT